MDSGKVTLGMLGALLSASVVCFALRHSADERREKAPVRIDSVNSRMLLEPALKGSDRVRDRPLRGNPQQVRAELRSRLDEICSQGNALARTSALLTLADRLNPGDFPELMAALLELDVRSYGDDQRLLLSVWTELDPGAALAWETAHVIPGRDSDVLDVWSQRDPEGALEWLQKNHPGPEVDLDLVRKVLRSWAARDASAALSWVESYPGVEERVHLAGFVINGLTGAELGKLNKLLPRLPEAIRNVLPQILAEPLAHADRDDRDRCLQSLPDSQRIAAVAAVINAMGEAPMAGKLELLKQYPEAMNEVAPASFYQSWVKEDADAALSVLREMPPGQMRKAAIFGAVEGLSAYGGDAQLALQLINDYPDDAGEGALAHWVRCAGPNHHEYQLAIDQLPRLSTPEAREQGLKETLESWFFNDAPAARAWMETHEVLSTVRQAMEGY